MLFSVVALVSFFAASLATAGGQQPLTFGRWFEDNQYWIEQQSIGWPDTTFESLWVHNPVAPGGNFCVWDVDDVIEDFAASGYLNAGASANVTECIIADVQSHRVSLTVHSSSPDLVVTLRYEPHGQVFTLIPRAIGGGYEYNGCVSGPLGSTTVPIADSNGGVGFLTTVTATVTNPTSKRQRQLDAFLVIGGYDFQCPYEPLTYEGGSWMWAI